jgi:hypothetical protein
MEDDTVIHQPFLMKVSYHRKQKVQNVYAGAENGETIRKIILRVAFVFCIFLGIFLWHQSCLVIIASEIEGGRQHGTNKKGN